VPVVHPRVRPLAEPKAGNSADEYEDACAKRHPWRVGQSVISTYAVADGATETSFARLWADLLVHAYTEEPFGKQTLEACLRPLQKRWTADVFARPLKYYARNKARQGAFAAFLGLTLEQREGSARKWHALAVGDCCVFHIQAGLPSESFPIVDWRDFGNSPLLLSSLAANNARVWSEDAAKEASGVWEPGDAFLLMSDALACWFLANAASDSELVSQILELGTEQKTHWAKSRFHRIVRTLRADGELRNDDVTLLLVQTDIAESDEGAAQ
jgi:protein phosphatase 2C-like protein